jgi:hypothetical protein
MRRRKKSAQGVIFPQLFHIGWLTTLARLRVLPWMEALHLPRAG